MNGEKNLAKLLAAMHPRLNEGEYVFCTTTNVSQVDLANVLLIFKEEEGTTLILKKEVADKLLLDYTFVAAWITLTVHSALEAVGLTAAFSKALAAENISCNIVAGYFHDHLFVPAEDAAKAMVALNKFSKL